MLQLIQQIVLLAGTATGAITDARTGYIYDWITYPMIVAGVVLSVAQSQWFNIEAAIIVFAALFAAYKLGKLGGGDVKLYSAIALLNPFNNIWFLASAIFFAAMGAIIFYASYYTIKYCRIGISLEENRQGIITALIYAAIILIYFGFLAQIGYAKAEGLLAITIPVVFGLVFIALQKGIKKNFFEAKIAVTKLEEDEVIAEGRNSKEIEKLLKGKQLIGEKEKELLRKAKIKSIWVLRKLPPFGPFILLGVIIALIRPEFIITAFG